MTAKLSLCVLGHSEPALAFCITSGYLWYRIIEGGQRYWSYCIILVLSSIIGLIISLSNRTCFVLEIYTKFSIAKRLQEDFSRIWNYSLGPLTNYCVGHIFSEWLYKITLKDCIKIYIYLLYNLDILNFEHFFFQPPCRLLTWGLQLDIYLPCLGLVINFPRAIPFPLRCSMPRELLALI